MPCSSIAVQRGLQWGRRGSVAQPSAAEPAFEGCTADARVSHPCLNELCPLVLPPSRGMGGGRGRRGGYSRGPDERRRGPRDEPLSFRAFAMDLDERIGAEEAASQYKQYLADFWGGSVKAEFEQRKNDPRCVCTCVCACASVCICVCEKERESVCTCICVCVPA